MCCHRSPHARHWLFGISGAALLADPDSVRIARLRHACEDMSFFAGPLGIIHRMKAAPIPEHDQQRLQALRDLLILDTPAEERFDKIVAFAAGEFDMPIALISLVDENRQWFKAKVGLAACETSRDISFCGHALESSDVLIVPDTHEDERFKDNPLVTGAPLIRFYAGAPLVLPSGHVAGTLCLIDQRPRSLDPLDLSILCALRDLVLDELVGEHRGA